VPLVFGEFVVGSVVVSAGLSTEELGTNVSFNSGVVFGAGLRSGKGVVLP
jgi:hypothetical protein